MMMQQGAYSAASLPIASKLEQDLNINASSKKRALEPNSPDDEDDKHTEDDKVAKKQRRLMKNREAAAQFRHRQKAYMQKLEKHAEELTVSNGQISAKIELLDTENKLMKEQLTYLRNFMKQAVSLSFPNSLPSLPPDSVVPPDFHAPPSIPDIFPDNVPTNDDKNKTTLKQDFGLNLVPDITNASPILPSSIPVNGIMTTPPTLGFNPSLILGTIVPPPIPPPALSTSVSPPVNNSNILSISNILQNTQSPLLGASLGLGSSTLSSIFNSVLGTDLSFSGAIVKTEPFGDVPPF